jgi:hypothetical protein
MWTSALVGGEWSASGPEERAPSTHWRGGWLDPRVGLDNLEKFLTAQRLELRPVGRLTRSQSPYRLCYQLMTKNPNAPQFNA